MSVIDQLTDDQVDVLVGLVSGGTPPIEAAVRITDRADAERFIEDLRRAVKRSRHSGGEYTAFVRTTARRLAVSVHLGPRYRV